MSKKRKGYFFLLGFCLAMCMMVSSGCALFGPSVQKAREVAQKRQDVAARATADLETAGHELETLIDEYNAAKATGDTTTVEAIEQILPSAVAKYKAAEAAAKSSKEAFDAAVSDFKDAESTSDYIGTILGWGTALLGGLFGGGMTLANGKKKEALAGVTEALEKTKSDSKAWPEAKATMTSKLSTGALKAIDAARP